MVVITCVPACVKSLKAQYFILRALLLLLAALAGRESLLPVDILEADPVGDLTSLGDPDLLPDSPERSTVLIAAVVLPARLEAALRPDEGVL